MDGLVGFRARESSYSVVALALSKQAMNHFCVVG